MFQLFYLGILANVLYLSYSPHPEEILNLDIQIIINNVLNNSFVMQMFWIILLCFMIFFLATKFKTFFGLKDYKSNIYKVTDDIEIPMRVGEKQTQQGSSWWLSSKQFPKVFNVNTVDPANPVIKELLYNADNETKVIKKIDVPTDEDGKAIINELKENIENEYSNLEKRKIPLDKTRIFKKGGIVLGKKERTIIKFTKKFPYIKARKVEDIYFVGDNVHTLTVGATRSGKTRCEVIESIMNCGLAGESMVISDPKRRTF